MSKPPSDATLLRQAKRDNIELQKLLMEARRYRDEYRNRATKAEQECAEWKARFDLLLRQPQPVQAISPGYVEPRSPSSADPLPVFPTVTCKG